MLGLTVEGQEDASEASQQTGSPWLQPKGAQGLLGLTQPGESPKEWGRGHIPARLSPKPLPWLPVSSETIYCF